MFKFNDSSTEINGSSINMSMPISKIDLEKRTVTGWATLNNLDRQGDVVDIEASIKAFSNFRKNLREMHQPISAGKVLSFKQDKYYDTETNKFYDGIVVSAYVSKGAQDTWEKVLDGTLTGFSIGGNIKDYEDIYSEEIDKSIRIIKDYELYELSLVDNPANQYANVISIEKNHDPGYLAKTVTDNVFWCSKDDLVQISAEASSDCPRCDKGMQNIGFVETNDADKAEVVKTILSRIKNEEKEVSKMAEEIIETTTETVEVEKTVDAPVAEAETVVEKADEENTAEKMDHDDEDKDEEEMDKSVEDKEKDEMDKAVDVSADVAKTISDALTSTLDTLADTVKALNEKIEDLHKTVSGISNEVSEVTKEVSSVRQEVGEVKGNFDEFGKRVDAVENDTAFRKSGDLGEIVQEPVMVQKSVWGGRFLKKSDLFI